MMLNDLELNVVKAIGEYGVSRNTELKRQPLFSTLPQKEISDTISSLTNKNLLNRELLRLGGRGARNFYIYELTPEGIEIYQEYFQKSPISPQKDVLSQQHKTLEIAYLFEDCFPFLEKKGILIEKKNSLYSLTFNGETCPLLLDAYIKGNKVYTRKEYFAFFDEMWKISPHFYYMTTSMIQTCLVFDELGAWIRDRHLTLEEKEKLQFHSTFMELILSEKNEIWDSIVFN